MNAERQTTDAEPEERLGAIVAAWLELAEAGQAPDEEEWLALYPDLAQELRDFFACQHEWCAAADPLRQVARGHQATRAAEQSTVADGRGEAGPASLPGGGLFGDYELEKEIGRGGTSVVYRARQISLNRPVALKVLHRHQGDIQATLRRFRHEAELIALLDHPAVVPILDVGEHAGQVFHAMKLVEGGSLADHLADFLARPGDGARLLVQVARAVDHAHKRGVLHRDLKPSNILLDRDGQPYVSDFGLGRRTEGESEITQSGAIVGTPSYMAPEQTAGRRGMATTATDVYGLGGILHALLTGRPPFRGESVVETILQVREGVPELARQRGGRIDRDLETICLKCLEKEPTRRYSTAAELADDLERYLAGEPIQARPIPPWVRAGKWARRRPAAAALVAFSGLAVLLLLGGLWWHTKALDAEVRRANDQRQRADRSYRDARRAIMAMLDRLDKFDAPGVPQVEALRRELNQEALAYFEGVPEAEAAAEPAVRFDIARALDITGAFLRRQGQAEAAARKLQKARHLLEQLVAEDSTSPDYQVELGQCLDALAVCLHDLGRAEERLHCLERALAVRQELARRESANGEWQRLVAVSHTNVGGVYRDRGDNRTTERHWLEARRIQEKLVRDHPGVAPYQVLLAVSYSNLASLYSDTGRDAEVEPLLQRSVAMLTRLVRDHPDTKRKTSWSLVMTLFNQGEYLGKKAERAEESRAAYTRAIDLAERMRKEDRHSPGVNELVIIGLAGRIQSSLRLHRRGDAEKDWQRALALAARAKNLWGLWECPRCQAQLGAHAQAAKWAQQLLSRKDPPDKDLYELVKAYGLAAAAAHNDHQLSTAEQAKAAGRYAAEAVALLNRLAARGFFKDAARAKELATAAELKGLHGRADFRRLREQVTSSQK